jgi:hypothetical protein
MVGHWGRYDSSHFSQKRRSRRNIKDYLTYRLKLLLDFFRKPAYVFINSSHFLSSLMQTQLLRCLLQDVLLPELVFGSCTVLN